MSDYDEQAQRYLILIEGGPPFELLRLVARSARLRRDGRRRVEEVEREMRAAIAFHLEGHRRGRRGDSGALGPRRVRRAQAARRRVAGSSEPALF